MNDEKIRAIFEEFGKISFLKIITITKESSRVIIISKKKIKIIWISINFFFKKIPKIICYLQYEKRESASKAKKEMDKKSICDTLISVR